MYGIAYPTHYRRNSRNIVVAIGLMITTIAVANVVAAGLIAPKPLSEMILCYNISSAFHPTFTKYYINLNLTFCVLSICIYASIACLAKSRRFKTASKSQQNNRFVQKQLAVLPMIRMLMVAYCIFGVFPEFIGGSIRRRRKWTLSVKNYLIFFYLENRQRLHGFLRPNSKKYRVQKRAQASFAYQGYPDCAFWQCQP